MQVPAVMAEEQGGRPLMTTVRLVLMEHLHSCSKATPTMLEPLWELIPGDLLERVLLFLPRRCQARFQTVCKRWWELMSSEEFGKHTSRIGFRRSYPTCMVEVGSASGGDVMKKRFKVREVDVPHLTIHSEVPAVATVEACWPVLALAHFDNMYRPRELCFRRQRVDETWENLSRIEMAAGGKTVWDVWLLEATGFLPQVFFSVRPVARAKPQLTGLLHRAAGSFGGGRRVQFGVLALVVLLVAAVMGYAFTSQLPWGGRV